MVHLPARTSSPWRARLEVESLRIRHDLGDASSRSVAWDDAMLVVSELVTNAIVHAGTAVDLDLEVLPGEVLEVHVSDGSRTPPARRPVVDASGGAGIRLVEQLSSDWGCDITAHGKTVWCRMPLVGAPDHPSPTAAGA